MIKVKTKNRCRNCKYWGGDVRKIGQGDLGKCNENPKLKYDNYKQERKNYWATGSDGFFTAKDYDCDKWKGKNDHDKS